MLAPLVNHFSPLSTQSSPSRTAVVCIPVASAPAARSVIEKQIRMSPLTSGTRYRSFCSVVAVLDQREHRRVLRAHAVQRPRRRGARRTADLDLHDRVGEVPEPHPAPLHGDERTPQAGGAGLGLQLGDDVEERAGAHLLLERRTSVSMKSATRARSAAMSSGTVKSIILLLRESGGTCRRRRARTRPSPTRRRRRPATTRCRRRPPAGPSARPAGRPGPARGSRRTRRRRCR